MTRSSPYPSPMLQGLEIIAFVCSEGFVEGMSNSNSDVPANNRVRARLRGIRRQAVLQLIQLCRRRGHLPARPLETLRGGQ